MFCCFIYTFSLFYLFFRIFNALLFIFLNISALFSSMALKKSVLVQKIIGFLVDSALIIYEPLKNSIHLFNRLFYSKIGIKLIDFILY